MTTSQLFEKNRQRLEDVPAISSRQATFLNFFWGGFILYVAVYVFRQNMDLNRFVALVQLTGLIILLFASAFLLKSKIENHYLKLVFFIFISWTLIVILRGLRFDLSSFLYFTLSADYGGILYIVPLALFFSRDLIFLKKIFDVSIILAIFFFLTAAFFKNDLLNRSPETQDVIEVLARNLALPSGFILLTYRYHSNKTKLLAFCAIAVALLLSVYRARRGLSITLSSVLIFSFFSYLFSTKQKLLVIYLSGLFICLVLLYANSIYNISNNKLLNFIAARGEEDTRTGVEVYFYNDMNTKDWIVGRGMNGEYYCPGIDQDPPSDYRNLIETGYLQIILKGGLIRLILFLLIAVPAAFLGLFFSANLLSKACAMWIIIALISLYPATVESFSLQYIIVWLSIALCYCKSIRKMPDEKIMDFFKGSVQSKNFPARV